MTLVYFTMSLRITSAKRSAVPPTGSYCCDSSFSRRSGWATAFTICACMPFTISRGVPAGAMMPNHDTIS